MRFRKYIANVLHSGHTPEWNLGILASRNGWKFTWDIFYTLGDIPLIKWKKKRKRKISTGNFSQNWEFFSIQLSQCHQNSYWDTEVPSHVTSTRASACLASKSTGEARRSCLERGVEVALQILMFTGKQTGCIHSPVMFHRMRTQTPNPAQCLIPGVPIAFSKPSGQSTATFHGTPSAHSN